jgi:hypothetical protein
MSFGAGGRGTGTAGTYRTAGRRREHRDVSDWSPAAGQGGAEFQPIQQAQLEAPRAAGARAYGVPAMQSISTSAFFGSVFTATVARAGLVPGKHLP